MWPAYSGCCSPNRSIGILQPLRVCVLQVGLSCRSRDANGQPERLPTRKSPTHSSSSQVLCIRILAQELKAGMQLAKNALPRDTFSAVTRTRASQTNATMLPRRGGEGGALTPKSPMQRQRQRRPASWPRIPTAPEHAANHAAPSIRQKVDFARPNAEPHHGPAGKLRPQTLLHPAVPSVHP